MLDWFGRTLLLVLAVLSTFAVIASLMAASVIAPPVPRVTPEDAVAGEGRASIEVPRPAATGSEETNRSPTAPGQAGETVAMPVPPDPVARWLEALTYAVLALAGFAAAGLLVLLRVTFHLAAIARGRP